MPPYAGWPLKAYHLVSAQRVVVQRVYFPSQVSPMSQEPVVSSEFHQQARSGTARLFVGILHTSD